MKVLALYLPQFHRIRENDEWWGDGFTEWTAVRKAKPLFSEHRQPRVPLNNNYYDLTQKDTFIRQATQILSNGLNGICMYHYWFKDGRKIMERPAELLLGWDDVELPFCFSWANETWARTWSQLSNRNVWTSVFNIKNAKEDEILLEQKYGNYQDWKNHFLYLLPFFKDRRYVTIDEKPVFVIYRPDDIPCLANMVKYWRELAIQNGLKGIYFVGNTSRLSQLNILDELFISEPIEVMLRSIPEMRDGIKCFDYAKLWNSLLSRKTEKKVSLCGFVGYDDTPRRGRNGMAVVNESPHIFEMAMTELIRQNRNNECEIMFLNAWNEWGEGMYLEPDEQHTYEFLNSLSSAIEAAQKKNDIDKDNPEREKCTIDFELFEGICGKYDREHHINRILDKWLYIKENGLNICSSLEGKRVAIYGYGLLGKHFIEEMERYKMKPVFVVDKNQSIYCSYQTLLPEDDWPDIDILVITATYDYAKIYSDVIASKNILEIISLEKLVMDI